MKRLALWISAALALCSNPAAAKDRELPASQQEIDVAIKTYIGCLFAQAKGLDDHISQADVIARYIQKQCDNELVNLAVIQTRGRNNNRLTMAYYIADRRADYSNATGVVLTCRRKEGPCADPHSQ